MALEKTEQLTTANHQRAEILAEQKEQAAKTEKFNQTPKQQKRKQDA